MWSIFFCSFRLGQAGNIQQARYKNNMTSIVEMCVKHQQSARLPQRDVPVFCGDPPAFRSFMKAFEHVMDTKTDNNVDKVFFLEQFKRGEPCYLLKSCGFKHPGRGFRQQCTDWKTTLETLLELLQL